MICLLWFLTYILVSCRSNNSISSELFTWQTWLFPDRFHNQRRYQDLLSMDFREIRQSTAHRQRPEADLWVVSEGPTLSITGKKYGWILVKTQKVCYFHQEFNVCQTIHFLHNFSSNQHLFCCCNFQTIIYVINVIILTRYLKFRYMFSTISVRFLWPPIRIVSIG